MRSLRTASLSSVRLQKLLQPVVRPTNRIGRVYRLSFSGFLSDENAPQFGQLSPVGQRRLVVVRRRGLFVHSTGRRRRAVVGWPERYIIFVGLYKLVCLNPVFHPALSIYNYWWIIFLNLFWRHSISWCNWTKNIQSFQHRKYNIFRHKSYFN